MRRHELYSRFTYLVTHASNPSANLQARFTKLERLRSTLGHKSHDVALQTYERLIDRLDTKGTLAHSPGVPGRPVKYDDTMLQASYELLLAATDPMSSTELV